MILGRWLRPTNRRIRLLVGLLLAGLICIQCTQTEAFRSVILATAIDGKTVGQNAPGVRIKLEKLAKTDHIALLEYCLDNYNGRYHDYTCQFVKQERINGALGKKQTISVKYMDAPFSVAMKWIENAPIGDRVLYVEGKNGNNMLVHPKYGWMRALAGKSVSRPPDCDEAMKSTLRPVSMFGFKRCMQNLLKIYRQADQAGDLKQKFGGYYNLNGRDAIQIVRFLPAEKDYPYHKTLIYIDLEHLVPIGIENWNWDGQLHSVYNYQDIKPNVGLTEDDFMPEVNGMK